MTVIGYLSDFSLPELFRLLEQGQKTGILTICDHLATDEAFLPEEENLSDSAFKSPSTPNTFPQGPSASSRHSIWFYEGRVVAYIQDASSDFLSLGDRLRRLCDLGNHTLDKVQRLCPDSRPLGHWLQEQGILQESQLQQLFREQVVQPTANLLKIADGRFRFRPQSCLPFIEMTGLSIPATALVLAGFRRLEDWSQWESDLPSTQAILLGHPGKLVQLSLIESKVLEQANGRQTLKKIATYLGEPILEIQKVAFGLHRAGLLDWQQTSGSSRSAGPQGHRLPQWAEIPQLVKTPILRGMQALFQ